MKDVSTSIYTCVMCIIYMYMYIYIYKYTINYTYHISTSIHYTIYRSYITATMANRQHRSPQRWDRWLDGVIDQFLHDRSDHLLREVGDLRSAMLRGFGYMVDGIYDWYMDSMDIMVKNGGFLWIFYGVQMGIRWELWSFTMNSDDDMGVSENVV